MGIKGSWISVLKRVFTSSSKDKIVVNGPEKKYVKEKKKWGIGSLRHGETNSFIPLHREPSSIEKILGDAEREHRKPQPLPSKKVHQSKPPVPHSIISPPTIRPSRIITNYTPKSAIKIQAAYRGYVARKSYRALKGLVRLQGVMRGQNVKRQTMNAMRFMQLFVRVQSQIRARRIQMTESQSLQLQTPRAGEKDLDSSFSKWSISHKLEADAEEEWDDSVLTKEEIDARMQRKVEAIVKRERALAYAYSHQMLNVTPKLAHTALTEIRSGGFPMWWNWLERQLPKGQPERPATPLANNGAPTTPKPSVESNARTRPRSRSRQSRFGHENLETPTPRSSKPFAATKARAQPNSPSKSQYAPSKNVGDMTPRDDESLTSCPTTFTVPSYMAPTLSAKAKARGHAFLKDGPPPPGEAKKRFSFGLSQSIGSLRWNKGSKDSGSQGMRVEHRPTHSIGNLSVDSTISLPVGVGRKHFK